MQWGDNSRVEGRETRMGIRQFGFIERERAVTEVR
jgi:hypothetical protein